MWVVKRLTIDEKGFFAAMIAAVGHVNAPMDATRDFLTVVKSIRTSESIIRTSERLSRAT
jgi:hypothetical protein